MRYGTVALTAAILLGSSASFAQEEKKTTDAPDQKEGKHGVTKLAAMLAIGNISEIECAKWAQTKASNEKVKEFAQLMVKDHTEFLEKLKPHTGMYKDRLTAGAEGSWLAGTADSGANRAEVVRTSAQTDGEKTDVQAAAFKNEGKGPDLVEVKMKIAQECFKMAKEEMGAKSGAEFDKCYVGSQIGAHMHMVATLKVCSEYCTGECKTLCEEGLKTAKAHMQHAKDLEKEISKS